MVGGATPGRGWCFPPVSAVLNGVAVSGNLSPPASECWPELSARTEAVLRRTIACRRRRYCVRVSSGEANPDRGWCFPPVSAVLNGVAVSGNHSHPASECWPELSTRMEAVLRRTIAYRRSGFCTHASSGEAAVHRRKTAHPAFIRNSHKTKRALAKIGGSSFAYYQLLCVFFLVWKRGLCAAFWPPLGPCWFLTRVPLLRAATGFFGCGAAALVPSFKRKG